ncbi:MAG: STAS domain-containing protein [Chloroflexi bacterium]|nr:STAS domain-containing protein [Chloroflexota bacterium]
MANSATFSVESYKRVDVVEIVGRIDSNNAPELDTLLSELLDRGRYQLVLDLSAVSYMSSAGLRALVGTLRTCKKNGGDVRLVNISARVEEVLDLAGLTSLFERFDDQVSAVGSF